MKKNLFLGIATIATIVLAWSIFATFQQQSSQQAEAQTGGSITAVSTISPFEVRTQSHNQRMIIMTTAGKLLHDNNTDSNLVRLLSANTESRIHEAVSLLEVTSILPQVKSIPYVNSISQKFMGIPQNFDIEKRKVAQDILNEDKDFGSIFFLTPRGDIYIGEPYSQQQQLPRLNYADRDWYKGVSATNNTYISAVFLSAAIHVPAVGIAVPVYESNDNTGSVNNSSTTSSHADHLLGYWVGIVNLNGLAEDIKRNLNLGSDNRILIVDHNGTQIADTGDNNTKSTGHMELKSFIYLQSVKNALRGKPGHAVDIINGSKKFVSYNPIVAPPHRWAILLTQPFNYGYSSTQAAESNTTAPSTVSTANNKNSAMLHN